jgi:Glycosyl hydrolases family 16
MGRTETAGYLLEFEDTFDGDVLDTSRWLPYHLPQWSSRVQSAARYRVGGGRLVLQVEPDQSPWCPEFDSTTRVSSLQTGVRSGPLGSRDGQHRFTAANTVREEQAEQRLYTPQYGRFELRAAADIDRDAMVALWMIGFEDEPHRSAEICIAEIFGNQIGAESASIGMGVHPFGDPAIVDDFAAISCPIDVGQFHDYAAEWTTVQVSFSVDAHPVRTVTQSPQYPMQVMLGIYDFGAPAGRTNRFIIDSFRGYRPSALR